MKNFDMKGKTALITGASKGIGAATVQAFAGAGANVVLLARSTDEIANLAGEIGPAALAIPCDISRFHEVQAAVDVTLETFDRLDVLIGNAGVIGPIADLTDTDPDAWGHTIDINAKGIYYGMRAALPVMLRQGAGTIITVSSGAAHGPLPGWSAYCTSKAAAYMLTRAADKETREKGIRVLGLSPGTVATGMQQTIKTSGVGPVARLDWSDHIPPEWPAQALLWMCTPDADPYLGTDISLRDDDIRRKVGLV